VWSNSVRKEKLTAPTYEPPTTETATFAFAGAKEAGEGNGGYRRELGEGMVGFDCFGDGIAVIHSQGSLRYSSTYPARFLADFPNCRVNRASIPPSLLMDQRNKLNQLCKRGRFAPPR
jgi:hypothetical protein